MILIFLSIHPALSSAPGRPGLQSLSQQKYYLNPTRELELLKKILVFERNMKSSPEGSLVMGLLYQSSSPISSWAMEDWLDLQKTTAPEDLVIKNSRLELQPVDLDSGQSLEKTLSELKVRLLYLSPLELTGRPGLLSAVIKTCEKLRVGTLTAVPEYLEAGVALGFVWQKDRYQIVINLEAARAQGLNFSSQFLKLTTVRKTNG